MEEAGLILGRLQSPKPMGNIWGLRATPFPKQAITELSVEPVPALMRVLVPNGGKQNNGISKEKLVFIISGFDYHGSGGGGDWNGLEIISSWERTSGANRACFYS